MIYPNDLIDFHKLKKMVNSPLFDVFVEDVVEAPKDWDWTTQGIYRGTLHSVKDMEDLKSYLSKILTGEVQICYEPNSLYFEKHPHVGEHCRYVNPRFEFQYSGINNYVIKEFKTKVKSRDPEERKDVISLDVLRYENDFEGTCYTIATWDVTDEGYEFRSIGSRLFEVPSEDFQTLWEGINEADKYLCSEYLKIKE